MQDYGKLVVSVGDLLVVVQLDAGDAILFRGDVLHAGACYPSEHWRMHEYWSPEDCERDLRVKEDDKYYVGLHNDRTESTVVEGNPEVIYEGPRYRISELVKAFRA